MASPKVVRFTLIFLSVIAVFSLLCNIVLLYSTNDSAQEQKFVPKLSAAKKESHDPRFTFSACLIVKDDNRILPEWLAYHYTVLPLRHLIVAIDPLSATSPIPILNKFQELGMNITVWEDRDYINGRTANDFKPATSKNDKDGKYTVHVHRQLIFYQQCLLEFKNRGNHTWTILIDTDEYLTFNYYNENEGNYTYNWLNKIAESFDYWTNHGGHPDYYNESVSTFDGMHHNFREKFDSGEHPRATLPKFSTVTISQYISLDQQRNNGSIWKKYPCINHPRLTFGSLEDSAFFNSSEDGQHKTKHIIPPPLDPLAF
jgi:hypothetical protein